MGFFMIKFQPGCIASACKNRLSKRESAECCRIKTGKWMKGRTLDA
jgi:hypothetical protein